MMSTWSLFMAVREEVSLTLPEAQPTICMAVINRFPHLNDTPKFQAMVPSLSGKFHGLRI